MNLQEIRERIVALKIERTDTSAELTEINSRLKHKRPGEEFVKLEADRTELAADAAAIDGELAQLNSRLAAANDLERDRHLRLAGVRAFACAIASAHPGLRPDAVITHAIALEEELQKTIPEVTLPALP